MGEVRWAMAEDGGEGSLQKATLVRGWMVMIGEVGRGLGPEPEGRRTPPISIAILGPWELRHKETTTILVELPLVTRLLWVLLSVHSRILPTPDLAANKTPRL